MITQALNFMLSTLVIPSQLPGTTTNNTGYFTRDHVTFTQIEEHGVTYQVKSDSQNGTDNEMSQDQLIHILHGYYLAHKGFDEAAKNSADAQAADQRLVAQVHDIGLRLKAYNYIVTTPAGTATKRGSDARMFAWPLAQTIALITGNSIDTYLTGIDIPLKDGRSLHFSPSDMKGLFQATLDAITTGLCNIKIGDDKHELCNRFTLSLINNLYVTSEYAEKDAVYIARMDRDGDYLSGGLAKLQRGKTRLPDTYLSALQSAQGTELATNTGPALWCYMSRWIFLPTTCPQNSSVWYNNGLDFLEFYEFLSLAPQLRGVIGAVSP